MPKRSPASAQAEDAPPVLDDEAVATVDTAPPSFELPSAPVPADSEEVALLKSMKWPGPDELIKRSITGEASIQDYETIHAAGFSDRIKLNQEQARIKRVAYMRCRAVSNQRLEELRLTSEKTSRRVELEIGNEQQRFARLKAEHESKIEGLNNELSTATRAYESANSARMELRSLTPPSVTAVWKMKAEAINTQFNHAVSTLGIRIYQYERILQLRLPQDHEAIRMAVMARHSPLFNSIFPGSLNEYNTMAHELKIWLAEVQARLSAELPQIRQDHARLSAQMTAAETDCRNVLDCYLPVE